VRERGPGGLTWEVETPSNQLDADHVLPFQLNSVLCYTLLRLAGRVG
jgi:hypothetical protein